LTAEGSTGSQWLNCFVDVNAMLFVVNLKLVPNQERSVCLYAC
jgi:hypothetical protein